MSWKVVDSANAEIELRSEPWCTEAMKASWASDILPRYETRHGALMPILHEVQHAYRHVSYQAMMEIANFLRIPPAEVLDTVSFYEEYTTEPVGKCVIGICQSIACEICGHQKLLDHCRDSLGIEPHETTKDGVFTTRPCTKTSPSRPSTSSSRRFERGVETTRAIDPLKR